MSFVRTSTLAIGILLSLGVSQAQAFEFAVPSESGNVIVEASKSIQDTFFGAGNDVAIRGSIAGDAIVAGQHVGIRNTIGQNVFAAGQTVTIDTTVGGGVLAAGETVTIDPGSVVSGDVVAAGDTIVIDGTVQGTLRAYGRAVTINGIVQKHAIIHAETIHLGSGAVVAGNITGTIDKPLVKESGARIDGRTDLTQDAQRASRGARPMRGEGLFAGLLASFLMSFVSAGLIAFLAPKYVDRLRTSARTHTWQAILLGIGSFLVAIPLFVVLCIFLLTLPLAFAVPMLLGLAMLLGHIAAYTYVGDLVSMAVAKKHWPPLGALAAGALIMTGLGAVPLIGALASCILIALGTGVVLMDAWHRLVGHDTK